MKEWYYLLKHDYNHNTESFLEYINNCNTEELLDQFDVLYAILHLCVKNDDGEAVRIVVQKVSSKQLESFEDMLFNNNDIRELFVANYQFDDLNLLGIAVKEQKRSVINELVDHHYGMYSTCSLSKWLAVYDILLDMQELSESYWEFCAETFFLDDVENVFLLLSSGRDKLAERILKRMDIFDRKYILEQVLEDIEKQSFSRYDLSISSSVTYECCEQILKKLIQIINEINAKNVWNCIGTIENIETKADDMCLIVNTDNCCYTAEIDTSRNCCEVYGGYIICEDDISSFIGASLLRISLTDTELNSHVVKKINAIPRDFHNIQFINFETSKGVLQFVVYNCHNGYYGHDITIRKDGTVIYLENI